MNIERMELLIQCLKEAKPENFDMTLYGRRECGTPACVLGHYAHRTDLQSAFRLAENRGSYALDVCDAFSGEPLYFDAATVSSHFDLNPDELTALFDADGCNSAETPQEAIEFIEECIARGYVSTPDND